MQTVSSNLVIHTVIRLQCLFTLRVITQGLADFGEERQCCNSCDLTAEGLKWNISGANSSHVFFWFLEEKCRGFYTLPPGSEKGKVLRFLPQCRWKSVPSSVSALSASPPPSPPPSTAMLWLSLSMELVNIGLLLISCILLSVQLCIRAWFPSTQHWGQLLNAFAAVFTVLGGTIFRCILKSEWLLLTP